MNTKRWLIKLLLLLLFSGGAALHAEELTITSWYDHPTLYGGSAGVSLDGSPVMNVLAGQLYATKDSTGESWITYCTDLGAALASGQFTAMPLSIAQSLPSWQTPDWAPGGIERAAKLYLNHHGDVADTASAVAMQVLFWEYLYDETPSFDSGRFQLVTASSLAEVIDHAEAWMTAASPIPLSGSETWWGPSSGGDYRTGQGLLEVYGIPEPGTLSLFLLALLCNVRRFVGK